VTTTNTQRVAALRQRRKAAGLVRVEYYLTPELAKKVRELINQLKAQQ
jgi:PHD/YefM family antitoxin component YafN of YafNO toxin-antitoxin module